VGTAATCFAGIDVSKDSATRRFSIDVGR